MTSSHPPRVVVATSSPPRLSGQQPENAPPHRLVLLTTPARPASTSPPAPSKNQPAYTPTTPASSHITRKTSPLMSAPLPPLATAPTPNATKCPTARNPPDNTAGTLMSKPERNHHDTQRHHGHRRRHIPRNSNHLPPHPSRQHRRSRRCLRESVGDLLRRLRSLPRPRLNPRPLATTMRRAVLHC